MNKKCKLVITQNSAELIILSNTPNDFKCTRISDREYINHRTGEVLEYSRNENNTKSLDSMRKTFKRLNYLITDNFNGGQSEVFITLGYNYTMSDTAQLNHDLNLFWRKLKRRYKNCEYISIAEYTEKRGLHLHILIKSSDGQKLVFARDFIIKIWGQNDVYIERIKTSKDIEKISKYLNPFTNPKKFNRLSYYERNFRVYNSSQGIIKPQIESDIIVEQALSLLEEIGFKKSAITSYDIVETIRNGRKITLNNVIKINFSKEK